MSLRIGAVCCALLLGACSMTPVASRVPGYLTSPKGRLLTDADGRCWRTAEWRPALAIVECDPEVVLARQEGAPEKKPEDKKPEKEPEDKKPEDGKPANEAVAAEVSPPDVVAEEPASEPAPATAVAGEAPVSKERAAAMAALAASMGQPVPATPAGNSARRFRDEITFEPLVLDSDASFFFGDDHLTVEGKQSVLLIADLLKARRVQDLRITVVGHTDRIGSSAANLGLSRRRAAAVKAALVAEGLPASAIEIVGMGASKPVTGPEQCPDRLVKCELISCLKPDRRVEIRTRGRAPSGSRQVPLDSSQDGARRLPQATRMTVPAAACTAG